jgi:OOP family OmpA-OmpF porin
MKKSALIALAVVGSMAVTAAHAQEAFPRGFYGQVSAGYLQLEDVSGNIGGTSVKGAYDAGYAVTAAVGFAFGDGLRTEFELGYGHSGYDSVTIGGTTVGLTGDVDMWSIYEGVYYDFNVLGVKPYLGGGFGVVHWDQGNVRGTANGTTFTGSGGNGTDFSLFGEAGVSLALTDRIDLVPAIRYLWIDDSGNGIDDDTAWLFKVGLRYRF